MRGSKYPAETREKAVKLRRAGKSYAQINAALGESLPKSTLASWFWKENVPSPFTKEKQRKHLDSIRPQANQARRDGRNARLETIARNAKREVKTYPLSERGFQKSILAALYWAEGGKYPGVSGLRFVNTDPDLLRLYLSLLRSCYTIDESKLRIRLHLHYYHPIRKSKDFWAQTLRIPSEQITSVYVKKRSRKKRFRKNFMGICFVQYGDSSIREELLAIGQAVCDSVAE